MTQYYADAAHGDPSPGQRLNEIWEIIIDKIEKARGESSHLKYVHGLVFFNDDFIKNVGGNKGSKGKNKEFYKNIRNLAEEIAIELIDLAKFTIASHGRNFKEKFDVRDSPFPQQFENILENLQIVYLWQRDGVYVSWECADLQVGSFGMSEDELCKILENKKEQSRTHNWGKVDEKWLLVYSEGFRHYHLGALTPEYIDWNRSDIVNLCKSSNFDRVIFWNSEFDWHKEIYKKTK